MTTPEDANTVAGGSPVERGVGRLEPERADADAPICPWCDQQIWNPCKSQYDTMTCVWRPLEE